MNEGRYQWLRTDEATLEAVVWSQAITMNYEDLENGGFLSANITDEGVIFDAYIVDEDHNDLCVGSVAYEWGELLHDLLEAGLADAR